MAQNILPFTRRQGFTSRMLSGRGSSFLPSSFSGDSFVRSMTPGGRGATLPEVLGFGRSYRMSGREVWAGVGLFAVGAVIGAGLGMLFAPKSGHALRSDISRMSGNARGMLPGSNREPEMRMSHEYGTQSNPQPRR